MTARRRGARVQVGAPSIAELARVGYEAHAAALAPPAGERGVPRPPWELVEKHAPREVAAFEAAALAILEAAGRRVP